MEVKFVPVTYDHITELARTLRDDDLKECLQGGYKDALEAVEDSVTLSLESWCCTVDGRVLAIFGVINENLLTKRGWLWLLTSDLVDERPKTFFKNSKRALAVLLTKWRVLGVDIGGDHDKAQAFASRCGFRFLMPTSHLKTGQPFMRHTIGG